MRADAFDESGNTLVVDGVVPGSAAEKAGLRRGDLVTEIDGATVTALAEVNLPSPRDTATVLGRGGLYIQL